MSNIEDRLMAKGVKPTANRIIVLKEMLQRSTPLSLGELEVLIGSLDKSSISRTLNLFVENDIVHSFEDGMGIVKYELCHSHEHCSGDDAHIHFWCESCHKSFCMSPVDMQSLDLPEDFQPHSISFVVKGLCPDCRK